MTDTDRPIPKWAANLPDPEQYAGQRLPDPFQFYGGLEFFTPEALSKWLEEYLSPKEEKK